ncbi:MAG: F0F1 ATP synthase subunit A [bacterium]
MSASNRFLIGIVAIGAAVYAVLSIAFARYLNGPVGGGLVFGVVVSAANVIGSYFLMMWGGRRGDRQFLEAFVGGMLGRFLVIGLALLAAYAIPDLGFNSTLYTILVAFFPLAGFEVYCVVRDLDKARASAPATKNPPKGLASIACAAVAVAATLVWYGAALAKDPAAGHAAETHATDAHAADTHGATADHAAGAHDAHGADTHGASADHAGDAHGTDAHGAHDEGDVFTHLFHHLNDEVVFPIAPVQIGAVSVDMSITKLVIMIWIACALNLAIFGTLARKSRSLVPTGRFQNFFESLVVFVKKDMVEEIMGHHLGPKFTPYFLTVFFFILFMNLLGLVPFMHTATGNIAVTAALALMTFIVMQVSGIREQGLVGYAKNIVPPGIPLWLYPIMLPVEILGMLTKPFALTIRLFANMTAGHVVILSLFGLLFFFKSIFIAPAVLGFVLFVYMLELLVAFLQAYIFTFLSILFVNACAHPEH